MGVPPGRPARLASALVWAAIATTLFVGFGFAAGRAVALTLVQVGIVEGEGADTLAGVSRVVGGLCLVGLARLYRRTSGTENAGSLAAWLAGWIVCLYAGSTLVARVSAYLAAGLLLAVLAVWGLWRWLRKDAERTAPRGAGDAPGERSEP